MRNFHFQSRVKKSGELCGPAGNHLPLVYSHTGLNKKKRRRSGKKIENETSVWSVILFFSDNGSAVAHLSMSYILELMLISILCLQYMWFHWVTSPTTWRILQTKLLPLNVSSRGCTWCVTVCVNISWNKLLFIIETNDFISLQWLL